MSQWRPGSTADGEGRLVQVRRHATVGWLHEVRDPQRSAPDPVTYFGDGRTGAQRSPVGVADSRLDGSVDLPARARAPDTARRRVPGFVSPLLALVAALSILEGYLWLNVISVDRWHPPALAFAVVTFAVAVLVVRPLGNGRRAVATSVVATAAVLLLMTVLALAVGGPVLAGLAGASDLVFAVTGLGAVAAIEHGARRTP